MIKIIGLTTTYLGVVLYTAEIFSGAAAALVVCGILAALPGVMASAGKVISGGM